MAAYATAAMKKRERQECRSPFLLGPVRAAALNVVPCDELGDADRAVAALLLQHHGPLHLHPGVVDVDDGAQITAGDTNRARFNPYVMPTRCSSANVSANKAGINDSVKEPCGTGRRMATRAWPAGGRHGPIGVAGGLGETIDLGLIDGQTTQ
jgi:hypothetical protein